MLAQAIGPVNDCRFPGCSDVAVMLLIAADNLGTNRWQI